MSDNEKPEGVTNDKVRISEEVLESLTGMVVSGASNVYSSGGSITDGIAGILGRKPLSKGVKVEVSGNDVKVDVSISVAYGTPMHIAAKDIQRRIREELESSTGMHVTEVNIHIVGLSFEKDGRKEEIIEEKLR